MADLLKTSEVHSLEDTLDLSDAEDLTLKKAKTAEWLLRFNSKVLHLLFMKPWCND